jgi:hypothetical protein
MKSAMFGMVVLAAGLIGFGMLPGVASADLVVNGGFETGDFTGWTINPSPTGDFPWTIDGSSTGPFAGAHFASTGCIGPTCTSGPGGSFLSQNLATTPGQTYTLSFAYNPNAGQTSELVVDWGGTQVFDQVNGAAVYTVHTITGLVPTDGSTNLTFFGRQDPDFNGLDNVSVNPAGAAAPEPSSLLLVTSVVPGLLGLGIVRRRKIS